MRIAAGVEYKGTDFFGWQAQTDDIRTVQLLLERALSKVADEPIKVITAGRTDTGVHAKGQVVHFDTSVSRDPRGWLLGVNSNLPDDVSITWVKLVSDEFDARYSATQRFYKYHIINRIARAPLKADFAHWVYQPLDVDKMIKASRCLLGEHDFTSFRTVACQANTPMRNLSTIKITKDGDDIFIEVAGNAFLHHMVRNIVGSLIKVGIGEQKVKWIAEVLQGKDRTLAGPTAPACGLCLERVEYPEGLL